MRQVQRGEVWLVDLGKPTGHEQAFKHPAVILQTDHLRHLNTVIVVPITSKVEKYARGATNVFIPQGEAGLPFPSVALCHQIRVRDKRKLLRKYGELPLERLSEIEAAVTFVLGLPA